MRKISFYTLIILVTASPLFFGSNNLLAWYFNGLLMALAVAFFATGILLSYEPISVPFRLIRLPLVLFTGVMLWAIFQTLPLGIEALSHPLWGLTSDALQKDVTGRVSVNPEEGWLGILRLLTYALVFWLALQFGRDGEKAKMLLYAIVIAITLYAVYGLVLKFLNSPTILWFEKQAYRNALSATFINRNSAATYFGLGCIILLTLIISHIRRRLVLTGPKKIFFSSLMHALSSVRFTFFMCAFVIIFAALVLTGSRGGLGATFVGLLFVIVLYIVKPRSSKASSSNMSFYLYLLGGGLFSIVIFGILESGGDFITKRLLTMELDAEVGRIPTYMLTWQIISDFPLTGTGLGSFANVFPMYRDSTILYYGVWDKAHNTYLELLIELGIPAAACLFLSVLMLWLICLKGFFRRRRNSHYSAIGLACSLLVGVHAFVDFSLQIQAITLTYMVVLGLAVSQSWGSQKQNL